MCLFNGFIVSWTYAKYDSDAAVLWADQLLLLVIQILLYFNKTRIRRDILYCKNPIAFVQSCENAEYAARISESYFANKKLNVPDSLRIASQDLCLITVLGMVNAQQTTTKHNKVQLCCTIFGMNCTYLQFIQHYHMFRDAFCSKLKSCLH